MFLYAFEESVDCHLLSSFCDDSNLHIWLFKYVLSTMGVSKESISKFLIGNRFHVKLRMLNPENCKLEIEDFSFFGMQWLFVNLIDTIAVMSRIQGRNEVIWCSGQEASLAPPCSNLRSFGSKSTVLKKVVVILLGFSGTPPQ